MSNPTPVSASPLLLALREATSASHQALEQRLPFFAEGFDLPAYRVLLEAYYGFHAPLDAHLAEHQAEERRKAPTLVRDLLALGLTPAQIDALPWCTALPNPSDAGSVLGVMYVLEGSTLGGQVLKRAMAERLGIDEHTGGAFLDVYGAETGRRWRAFLERLAAAPVALHASAVDAAVATFQCFDTWLASRHERALP